MSKCIFSKNSRKVIHKYCIFMQNNKNNSSQLKRSNNTLGCPLSMPCMLWQKNIIFAKLAHTPYLCHSNKLKWCGLNYTPFITQERNYSLKVRLFNYQSSSKLYLVPVCIVHMINRCIKIPDNELPHASRQDFSTTDAELALAKSNACPKFYISALGGFHTIFLFSRHFCVGLFLWPRMFMPTLLFSTVVGNHSEQ